MREGEKREKKTTTTKKKKRRKKKTLSSHQVRQRRHPRGRRGVLLIAVDLREAREAVGAVDVHRARAADALAEEQWDFLFLFLILVSFSLSRSKKEKQKQKKKLQTTHRHDRRNASVVSCSSLILKSTSSIIGPQLECFLRKRERDRKKVEVEKKKGGEKKEDGSLARSSSSSLSPRKHKKTAERSSPAPFLEPRA